jgi:hypothetical protein
MSAFHAACDRQGVKASAVIRDLCAAAIPYMADHCPTGRWIAPSLVPFGSNTPPAGVVQVVNGHSNHVKAHPEKKRKA